MSITRKQIRIISLGEIVTPDIMKSIQTFTALIAGKKQAANLQDVGKSVGFVLQQNMKLINDFKLGSLNEEEFTTQMINALDHATGIKLSIDEFDSAWNAMNPKFQKFESLLKQAIDYNNQPDQKIIFISFTNPKDIRHLINELKQNNQNHQVINDQLNEICGIQLFTTYSIQKTKAELIEETIKVSKRKSQSQSLLVNSMSNILSLEQDEPVDVKYVRCVNDIKDPILKADLDATNQEVEKKASNYFVETVFWMKCEQTLSDALNTQQAPRMIATTKL